MTSISSVNPQMILNLETKPDYIKENFFIGPSNQLVFQTLMDIWPYWPSFAQIVIGPGGSGKTHLATIWQNLSQATFIDAHFKLEKIEKTLREAKKGKGQKRPAFILDINHFPEKLKEKNLFHLYNLIQEEQGFLLILSRDMPQKWPLTLPDLKSRLFSLPVQQLLDPDEEVLSAVLRKRFADYQMILPENVFAYVLPRLERSFKAAHDFAQKINIEAMTRKKNVNLSLAKLCLSSL